MYRYNPTDQQLVDDRVAQFRDQMNRFLGGRLSEDEFRPLRLQNGLYVQRHAPMLRVAIPYGTLASAQLRKLADIARRYDRGYGHFTTRCNIQFNWVRLEEVPDILAELATVQMHAIQTSGNCIRNITTDPFAGVAADELFDPRPYCEIVRQWSTLAPEFLFLPRKFKIAISGGAEDRAAVRFHDIGARARMAADGRLGFEIHVGGGLGRTPMVGRLLKGFLPREELLNYFEAILRVYNRHGRRDNKYKARIKILVKDLSLEGFAKEVEDGHPARPVVVVHHGGRIGTVERHEALDLGADPLDPARHDVGGVHDPLTGLLRVTDEAGGPAHQHERPVPRLLQATCEQELHQVAGVHALGGGIEAHIELHGPLVQMRRQRVRVCRVGNQPTPPEVLEECVHAGQHSPRRRRLSPRGTLPRPVVTPGVPRSARAPAPAHST